MSAEGKKIAVGVFCADWRLHQEGVHINNAVKEYLNVEGVDVIALPGPDGLCVKSEFEAEREVLTRWLRVLIGAHQPVVLAFVAHYNCAGHPVVDAQHDEDIEATMRHYKETLGFNGELVALCATYEGDKKWPLKEIARIPAEAK